MWVPSCDGVHDAFELNSSPVDVLKIDRSFVSTLGTSEDDRELVAGIVSLARSLHMGIVAEGVETAEQAAIVTDLGCDRAQGFFFAEPVEAADLMSLCVTGSTAEHR